MERAHLTSCRVGHGSFREEVHLPLAMGSLFSGVVVLPVVTVLHECEQTLERL